QLSVGITVVAALGILASTFYALRMVQRVFHGENTQRWQLQDLSPREALIIAPMIAALLWLGLYPQPILNTFAPAMHNLQREANLPAVVWQKR
ncbi:MAG: hypothetical protein KGJ48_12975, partial [Nitrospirota bacterium]|nr:hypothetical protein [Nitrospirota bacterium]